MEKIESRVIIQDAEVRVHKDSRTIEGTGIVFNKWSRDLGGFKEIIKPKAVSERLLTDPNIVAAVQHNLEKVMGRVGAGTLQLKKTTTGVNYRFDAPNTTSGNDLLESVGRGDINGSSFVFRLARGGSEWKEDKDNEMMMLRTVTEIEEIREMGPVVGEAYEDTKVARRDLEDWKTEHTKQPEEGEPIPELQHELRRKQLLI